MSTYKKRNSGKGLKALAIAVAAIVVVGATYTGLSVGLGSWNPAHWTGENLEQELTPEQQSGAILEETSSNGVKLASNTIAVADYENYGISPLAETAYTLTATVYDDSGSTVGIPQNVNFSAAWENPSSAWAENPSSAWASGKDISDYYSVTSTGVNTATGACLQAFGEPIIITATAAFNEDAYTTWEANYVKRVEEVTFTASSSTIAWGDVAQFEVDTITYGVGTVEGELEFTTVESGILNNTLVSTATNTGFYDYFIEQAGDLEVDFGTYQEPASYSDGIIEASFEVYNIFETNLGSEAATDLESATDDFEYFIYAMNYAATQTTNDVNFLILYEYSYLGETYSSGTITSPYPVQSSVSGNEIDLIY